MPPYIFIAILGPCLLLYIVYRVIQLIRRRDSFHLVLLLKAMVFPIFLLGTLSALDYNSKVNRGKIIGEYHIDTTFFPGENATWQKKHFRFVINDNDEFIFYSRLKDGNELQYLGEVSWRYGRNRADRWSLNMSKSHHVIDPSPTLYRGKGKFYYVFKSKHFGNMFFRKIGGIEIGQMTILITSGLLSVFAWLFLALWLRRFTRNEAT